MNSIFMQSKGQKSTEQPKAPPGKTITDDSEAMGAFI